MLRSVHMTITLLLGRTLAVIVRGGLRRAVDDAGVAARLQPHM